MPVAEFAAEPPQGLGQTASARGGGIGREAQALLALSAGLLVIAVLAIGLGRFGIPPLSTAGILLSNVLPFEIAASWTPVERQIVLDVRLPRILLAGLAGAGLGLCGAALQGVYRNPLVEPSIIGASAGAAFGGALSILLAVSGPATVSVAFASGLGALVLVHAIAGLSGRMSVLALVLSGVVTSAFFSALVSLTQFLANPETTLPAIVYWLMGSFATATYAKVTLVLPCLFVGGAVLMLLRFRLDLLSLGEEEAATLLGGGRDLSLTRAAVLVAVALVTAAVVSVAGIVGWIGLLAPHIARMAVGPGHRALLPASGLIGAGLLIVVDCLARTATAAEIPLSVVTALVGTPVFALLLRRMALQGWSHDRD